METTGQQTMKRSADAVQGNDGEETTNKKSRGQDQEQEVIKLFDNMDLAPHVVEYLPTVSLARFTQTNKQHQQLRDPEIARRKAKLVDYENQVKALMGSHDTEPAQQFTRQNATKARKIIKNAKFLLNGQQKKPRNPYFQAEQAKFKPPRYLEPRQVMALLPGIFYTPSKRDPTAIVPNQHILDFTNRKCSWLWGAEDHGFSDPFFQEIMYETAAELAEADPEVLEAFRKAARALVYRTKFAMKCMQHTLSLADKMTNEK